MKVIIMGCGRVGSRLAVLMEQDGNEVSIIDADPESFSRLPDTFMGQTVLGTGIDVDVLKSAGVEQADAFAAVTNFDNTNIMACEVAKEIFGVERVLARIYDPGRESFYHELGLETVCPTTLVSTSAYNILSPERNPSLRRPTTPLPSIPSTPPVMVSPEGSTPVPVHLSASEQTPAAPSQTSDVGVETSTTTTTTQPSQQETDAQKNGRGGLRGLFRP